MKAVLSIFLGLMLLTSLVGISYATPVGNLEPLQGPANQACNSQTPNNSNYNQTQNCHDGGNGGRDPGNGRCVTGQKAPDFCACGGGRKAPDGCCNESITPHGLEVSDIQAEPTC